MFFSGCVVYKILLYAGGQLWPPCLCSTWRAVELKHNRFACAFRCVLGDKMQSHSENSGMPERKDTTAVFLPLTRIEYALQSGTRTTHKTGHNTGPDEVGAGTADTLLAAEPSFIECCDV